MFLLFLFFFFNDTATTEIYTLSLHDALPISQDKKRSKTRSERFSQVVGYLTLGIRSEEHTSELQSHSDLVCRLLLEKKKNNFTAFLRHEKITIKLILLHNALSCNSAHIYQLT